MQRFLSFLDRGVIWIETCEKNNNYNVSDSETELYCKAVSKGKSSLDIICQAQRQIKVLVPHGSNNEFSRNRKEPLSNFLGSP